MAPILNTDFFLLPKGIVSVVLNVINKEALRKYPVSVFPVTRMNIVLPPGPTMTKQVFLLPVWNVIPPAQVGVLRIISNMMPWISPSIQESTKGNGIVVRIVIPPIRIQHSVALTVMNIRSQRWTVSTAE